MRKDLGRLYDESFYNQNVEGMYRSALIVLDLLFKHYCPEKVIDIGCGRGAWLVAAESLGAKTLKGIDGEWIRKESLLSENIDFTAVNFDKEMPTLATRYDLCMSLEVAEHISEANAQRFVSLLCSGSQTVLFGAAIKYQGGTNHINEQWQSYWIDLFRSKGYACLDLFRGALWNDPAVEWWYAQNTFLFVGPGSPIHDVATLKTIERPILDIAHPRNYESKVKLYKNQIENPSLQFCLDCARRYLESKIRKMLNRWS